MSTIYYDFCTDHLPPHSREIDKLDRLFGLALLDDAIAHRLRNHDIDLYAQFGLSRKTRSVLQSMPPMSLTDLAAFVLRELIDKMKRTDKIWPYGQSKTNPKRARDRRPKTGRR
jgi:hypothetical protein